MAEINHHVGIKASPEKIYDALTNISELAKWWTSDTRGSSQKGSTIEFYFGDFAMHMKVLELSPSRHVKWECTQGDEQWIKTTIEFKIEPDENDTSVFFCHQNWKQATPLLAHCSTKWAVFMLSLKELLETGKGRPYPNDIQINSN